MLLISTGDLAFADMLRQVDSSSMSAILKAIDQKLHFYEVKVLCFVSRSGSQFYLFMGPGHDLKLPRVLREKGLPLYRDGKPLPSMAQHPRVGFCQTLVFTERSDRSGLACIGSPC